MKDLFRQGLMLLKSVFMLDHVYTYEIGENVIYEIGENVIEEGKLIGFFSTYDRAIQLVGEYHQLEGYKDYPITCFKIKEYILDKDEY